MACLNYYFVHIFIFKCDVIKVTYRLNDIFHHAVYL